MGLTFEDFHGEVLEAFGSEHKIDVFSDFYNFEM